MATTREEAIVQSKLDRRCKDVDLAKLAGKIVSWEKYAPYCGLSPPEEEEVKHDSQRYVVQKRRMLERWKEKSGDSATYRNLVGIFERVELEINRWRILCISLLRTTKKKLSHTIEDRNLP